jgi:hypothetical protein
MAALQPTYPVAFPANQAPADFVAATSTFVAPAIAADAVQNAAHLVHAARETKSKKRAREDGKLITDDDFASALVQQHAIQSEHARAAYGTAEGMPAWGVRLQTTVGETKAIVDEFKATLDAFIASSTTRLIGLFSILKLQQFTVLDRDRNMTARIMNATSNTAEYQFQDIFNDAGVLPVNFPRTRDQFNALTGKCPLGLVLSMHSNDC